MYETNTSSLLAEIDAFLKVYGGRKPQSKSTTVSNNDILKLQDAFEDYQIAQRETYFLNNPKRRPVKVNSSFTEKDV